MKTGTFQEILESYLDNAKSSDPAETTFSPREIDLPLTFEFHPRIKISLNTQQAKSHYHRMKMPATPRQAPQYSERQRAAIHILGELSGESLSLMILPQEVKSLYRKLLKTFHPDFHLTASPTELRRLTDNLSRLKEAYQEFSSDLKR
jgi:hypothetical protein